MCLIAMQGSINKNQLLMHYKPLRRMIACLAMSLVCIITMAQSISVSGTVKDSMGEPIPGAAVLVAGTTQGTVTDFDGNYTLGNVPSNASLRVSFVGYEAQELPVNG